MMAAWRTSDSCKASWTRWPAERQPLFDAMAEDVSWRWMGVSSWSRTFKGKQQVVGELFGGVEETLTSLSVHVHQVLADGEHVVVEHTGQNTTPDGRRYDKTTAGSSASATASSGRSASIWTPQPVTETFTYDPS